MRGVTAPFQLFSPTTLLAPVIFTSGHSGQIYPAEFLAATSLDRQILRRSEDGFVDQLFAAAPDFGMPLLVATFPRAFCDVNREAWELDPAMFSEKLPAWVNTQSLRAHSGLGTMARVVGAGTPIYRAKLPFAEAEHRVRAYWQPWHDALAAETQRILARFGVCLVVDCHSMPRAELAPDTSDCVLGDLHGRSCAPRLVRELGALMMGGGYRVRRNLPYAGGFVTHAYGVPARNRHAVQIELARDLYMDEATLAPLPGLSALQAALQRLMQALAANAAAWIAGEA